MDKYVAIVRVDGMELFVIDGNEPKLRIFDDKDLAEEVAKILSPDFFVLTFEEFEKRYGQKTS